ncbi:hypothetical protein E1301_Tti006472 [Triplophysa tibetana]|uniref:Uncharacterized protein n=1 Tax=Triplophysa tibetana TaxID=1572043 RepID=A0A5A9NYJ9_9TELE|nr:hypothetical protein E1301_Tti006472 [Triplophysa tibetana]
MMDKLYYLEPSLRCALLSGGGPLVMAHNESRPRDELINVGDVHCFNEETDLLTMSRKGPFRTSMGSPWKPLLLLSVISGLADSLSPSASTAPPSPGSQCLSVAHLRSSTWVPEPCDALSLPAAALIASVTEMWFNERPDRERSPQRSQTSVSISL